MTDEPAPVHPQPEERQVGKGTGCIYGGLAIIASALVGVILAGFVTAIIPDSMGWLSALILILLPIGVLVGAAIRWKKVPGFLLGIGLTFAISITVSTGCAALLLSTSS